MKQCPTCKTTYTDETLRFCLADGAPLVDLAAEQPTIVQAGSGSSADKTVAMHAGERMRVDVPQSVPSSPRYESAPVASSGSSGGLLKVLLIVFGLGLFIVLIALVGTVVYYNMRPERTAGPGNEVKTPNLPSPTPTKPEDDLRDQIANLQKQLAEQKNSNRPANPSITIPTMPSSSTTTARVNSPSDGFLALRTLPNSELGDRILKIPHGATVSIGACGPVVRPVSKSGRWCQASYAGRSGWVFDAFLIY